MENVNLSLFNNSFLSRPKANTVIPHATLNASNKIYGITNKTTNTDISECLDILYNNNFSEETIFTHQNPASQIKTKTIKSGNFWI